MGLVGQMSFTFVHNRIMFNPSTVFAKMLRDTSKEVAIVVDCSDQTCLVGAKTKFAPSYEPRLGSPS